ncbi:cell wall-active antibiotics response protein LiaF [Cohnella faecalis]|uniref:cell wall-active antibiotics response protein LiaF n=1 Tax=Cohnella faecalis TaxID=2315694 RepID=UPI001F2CA36A|nr:cell wall-active antibiotics response protein LiaF [Cohnella faecalis]
MNISMFIGDTTIDLTKAQIPSGETKLYISSFIGDVKVFVPNDANIGVQVVSSCLIGDVSILDQKRGGLFNQTTVETLSYQDTEKKSYSS